MVRPLKMAALLLSVHPLPNQCLLHLHPTHMTDLPAYLSQAPASNCSYQRGSEGLAPLLVSLVTNEPTQHQFLYNWQSPSAHPPQLPTPPPGAKTATTVGCLSRTLLQTCKLPHSLTIDVSEKNK